MSFIVDRRIELVLVARSAWFWFVARLILIPLLTAARVNPLVLDPRASAILIGTIGTISWLDARSQNEDLLLGNLGTSRFTMHTLGFGAPFILECVTAVIS